MNKITKYLLVLSGLIIAWPAVSAFADEYDELAKDLCNVDISTMSAGQGKIAILPFSYLDKRKSDGGAIVSERLTTRIVKLKKYQVIERALLENLIQEQHLETSGAVSPETAKQIGKVLGVDAVISGTLLDIEDGMVEVNARLIKTESAEVINTASVSIRKIWSDVSASPPPPSSYQQPQPQQQPQQVEQEEAPVMKKQAIQQEQPVYQKPARAPRPTLDGYFDIFSGLGSGSGSMNLVFNNTSRVITGSELDFNLNGNNGYKKYSFNSLNTDGTSPIGARVLGFGKHWGFGIECSYFEETVAKQDAKVSYDGGSSVDFNFGVNDYFKVSVLNLLSVDVLYRFTNKMIQPYIGAGIGIALNTFTSPYITQDGSGSTLSEISAGFLLRAPILGVRVNIGEDTALFIEQRTIADSTYFTRNYTTGENDTVYLTASQTIIGIGFKFSSLKK